MAKEAVEAGKAVERAAEELMSPGNPDGPAADEAGAEGAGTETAAAGGTGKKKATKKKAGK